MAGRVPRAKVLRLRSPTNAALRMTEVLVRRYFFCLAIQTPTTPPAARRSRRRARLPFARRTQHLHALRTGQAAALRVHEQPARTRGPSATLRSTPKGTSCTLNNRRQSSDAAASGGSSRWRAASITESSVGQSIWVARRRVFGAARPPTADGRARPARTRFRPTPGGPHARTFARVPRGNRWRSKCRTL